MVVWGGGLRLPRRCGTMRWRRLLVGAADRACCLALGASTRPRGTGHLLAGSFQWRFQKTNKRTNEPTNQRTNVSVWKRYVGWLAGWLAVSDCLTGLGCQSKRGKARQRRGGLEAPNGDGKIVCLRRFASPCRRACVVVRIRIPSVITRSSQTIWKRKQKEASVLF